MAEKIKKPFYKKWWVWLIAIIIVAAVASAGGEDTAENGTEDTANNESNNTETTDTDEVGDEAEPTEDEPAEEPAEEVKAETYPTGQLIVGDDIQPGLYKSQGEISYWARLAGFSGELDDIIANGAMQPGQIYVEIEETDAGFESQGSGEWIKIDETYEHELKATFGDGMFIVGKDIEPGTYKNDGSASMGYWARVSDFSGSLDSIIANDNVDGQATVEISETDYGFTSQGMGTWTKVQ